jgi:hypothetical protein
MADLMQYHAYRDSVRWRLVADGVEIEGSGVERTGGAPATATRIWESYSTEINAAATEFDVPCALIVATIATESGGKADAIRLEPGYTSDEETPGKVSPGLMQTLISTARQALPGTTIDRNWLFAAGNSIRAGTAYISQQRTSTELDPPLVAAAYNAGSLRHNKSDKNRWKLVQYPIGTSEHCDRFVKWFNDAVAVLATHATRPTVPYERLLQPTAKAESRSFAEASADGAKIASRIPPESIETTETAVPIASIAAGLAADGSPDGAKIARRIPPESIETTETAVPV